LVLLRPSPLRLRWELSELLTSDGHALMGSVACSVRAIPDRTERRMLEEVLLDGQVSVNAASVAAHFLSAMRSAAARVARQHPASDWVSNEACKQELIDALKIAATSVAFSCGVEILPPFQLDVQSPTFERQRLREMQQSLAEKQAAEQVEHFHRAAELFKQYESLRAAAPQLSPGRVLQQIGPADQGAVLRTLLMAGARGQAPQKLWAVAGPYLVQIDARADGDDRISTQPNLFPLPPTLGPLRSVRAADVEGQCVLLVGARGGFILFDPQRPDEPRLYHDSAVQTEHGFNRIIYWPQHRQFCGTHADAGLVCWDVDAPNEPKCAQRTVELLPMDGPAQVGAPSLMINSQASYAGSMQSGGSSGPRNLAVLGGAGILFSIGPNLFIWDGQKADALASDGKAEVIAILSESDRLLCVSDDGSIGLLDSASRQWIARDRRVGRVRAAGALPWLGSMRLLLAGDEGPIQCIGIDDPLVTHYSGPYRGLRMVAGSAEMVAASSPDRQRVILWNSWDGRQPAGELFVTSATRHRITDLAFG
jgi:hypothetical protein